MTGGRRAYLREHGVDVRVLAQPGETEASARRTIDFAHDIVEAILDAAGRSRRSGSRASQ